MQSAFIGANGWTALSNDAICVAHFIPVRFTTTRTHAQRRRVQIFNNMLYNGLALLLCGARTNAKMPAYAAVSISMRERSVPPNSSQFDSRSACTTFEMDVATRYRQCESIRTIQPIRKGRFSIALATHWSHRSSRLLNGTLVPLF